MGYRTSLHPGRFLLNHCKRQLQPRHAPQPRHTRTRAWNHDGTTGSCPGSLSRQAKKRGCCIHTRAHATMERTVLSASYRGYADDFKTASCDWFLVYRSKAYISWSRERLSVLYGEESIRGTMMLNPRCYILEVTIENNSCSTLSSAPRKTQD